MRNTDFMSGRWGVFMHFLTDLTCREDESPANWNARVNAFDTVKLARQLHELQAGWLMLTIGQNSGYYCSPNRTLDELTGRTEESHCSRRDLILEAAEALAEYRIPLFVYLPGGAPFRDRQACEALEWSEQGNKDPRQINFQRKWERVIREWSQRWGKSVAGWWIDGCYFHTCREMYDFPDEPNFRSFAGAMRAGNPDSLVCWNPGVADPELYTVSPEEDYTAGECKEPRQVLTAGRYEKQALSHVLSYVGEWWGWRNPRFTEQTLTDATFQIVKNGGAVTWDVPYEADGTIPEEFAELLRSLPEHLKARRKESPVTGNLRFHWSALIQPRGEYPTREHPGKLVFAAENTSPEELSGVIGISSPDMEVVPRALEYRLRPGEKLPIHLELKPADSQLRCGTLHIDMGDARRTFLIPVRSCILCGREPQEFVFPGGCGSLWMKYRDGRLSVTARAKDDARVRDDRIYWEGSCLELFLALPGEENPRQFFAFYGRRGTLYFLRRPEGIVPVADTEFDYRDTVEGVVFDLSLPLEKDALIQVALHVSIHGKFGYYRLFGDVNDFSTASYANLRIGGVRLSAV